MSHLHLCYLDLVDERGQPGGVEYFSDVGSGPLGQRVAAAILAGAAAIFQRGRQLRLVRSVGPSLPSGDCADQRLTSPGVPFDAVRRGNKVIVNFDLPSVAKDSIDLTVERNVLSLNAERGIDWQDDEVIANERRQGTFIRQLFLGDTLDTSKVEASYDRGVLTVTIPVAETAQPRNVAITGTEGKPEPIQAESTEATASAAPD